MARYIDAKKIVAWCNETFQAQSTVTGKAYVNAFLTAVLSCTTADVVPRAEVEELKAENERLTDLVKELQGYNEAFVEDDGNLRKKNKNLAREILDEIIKIINNEFRKCERDEVQIVLKISHAIFELKKKYTEGGESSEKG